MPNFPHPYGDDNNEHCDILAGDVVQSATQVPVRNVTFQRNSMSCPEDPGNKLLLNVMFILSFYAPMKRFALLFPLKSCPVTSFHLKITSHIFIF